MVFPLGRRQERARQELEEHLARNSDRIEALETTPAPSLTKEHLERAVAALLQSLEARLGPVESRLDGVESAISDEERRVKALTFAVSEGIERVARHERRIIATVKRARKELADHGFESPGMEAEAAELRLVDGAGSGESEVSPMPALVDPGQAGHSSIKGVPAETLARVRGF